MPTFPKPRPLSYDPRLVCNYKYCRKPSSILLCGIGFCDDHSNKLRGRIGDPIPGGNRLAFEVFHAVLEEVQGHIRVTVFD